MSAAHQFSFKVMGGPCQLTLHDCTAEQASEVCIKVKAELERLEQKYSRFRSDSVIARLNRGELNGCIDDAELVGLLNYVDQCYCVSDGLFDPTIGVLRQVWDFSDGALPPNSDEINALQPYIGWHRIAWDGQQLAMPESMSLDLGGVVKEFAGDRVRVILSQHQVAGLINLAGDISVNALPQSHSFWPIHIRHPRTQGVFTTLPLYSGAIACSGDYERYIEYQGRRYCHILRPDTGFPAESGYASVSVLADSCLTAGSMATIAMLKGEAGLPWLQEMEVPFMVIDRDMNAIANIKSLVCE